MMGELRPSSARRRIPRIVALLALAEACSFAFSGVQAGQPHHTVIPLPQYHYGARIPVTCLNRSMYVFAGPCFAEHGADDYLTAQRDGRTYSG